MEIKSNDDISKLNTFGVSARAKFFVEVSSEKELEELFSLKEFGENKKVVLGGGSNVLFSGDVDGMVVLNKLQGIEVIYEDENTVTVRALAGEVWHDLVLFTVERGYWGIENLSLIPGTVGAAPMQNIGAYGVELKDVLESVEAYEIDAPNKKRIFTRAECELGYRDSIFKNEARGKYIITAVTLQLSKKEKKNLSYKILTDYLREHEMEVKSSKDISDAVADIRRSKLPDPKVLGNAGSFFKNVFLSSADLERLRTAHPEIPSFEEPSDAEALAGRDGMVKVPAAWLIEHCGPLGSHASTTWKGYREGNVGVHEKHALILVNYGGASGQDILNLANKIIASVQAAFGITLVPEVNLI